MWKVSEIVLTDIYAAREKNTIGISSKDLLRELQKLGKADSAQTLVNTGFFGDVDSVDNVDRLMG